MNFNVREQKDWNHSYEYLGGMLGREGADAWLDKKLKKGKFQGVEKEWKDFPGVLSC